MPSILPNGEEGVNQRRFQKWEISYVTLTHFMDWLMLLPGANCGGVPIWILELFTAADVRWVA